MLSQAPVIYLAEDVPSLNKGEAAILSGLLVTIRRHCPEARFLLYSSDVAADSVRYGSSVQIVGNSNASPNGWRGPVSRRLRDWLFSLQIVGLGLACRAVGSRILLGLVRSTNDMRVR